ATHSTSGMAWGAGLSLVGVIPLALIGHSSSGDDHFAAVNSIGLHLLGVLLWVGGLFVLIMIAPLLTGTAQLQTKANKHHTQPIVYTVLTRYSAVAGIAIALVAAYGVAYAAFCMDTLSHFISPYGLMVLLNSALPIV